MINVGVSLCYIGGGPVRNVAVSLCNIGGGPVSNVAVSLSLCNIGGGSLMFLSNSGGVPVGKLGCPCVTEVEVP